MKKLMVLGASILQLPAIKQAKEMDIYVVAVDVDPNAIGFEYADECEIISTVDTDKIVVAAQTHKIQGIMTLASDTPMVSVARVAEIMGLKSIGSKCALNATNKALMRDCLRKNKVAVPTYYKVADIAECIEAVSFIRGYCMVKPVDNSGSRGVSLLKDVDNMAAIYAAYEYSSKNSRCGNIIVEEFMQGSEVSVETMSVDGVCYVIQITDKVTTGAPYFVEMGHSQPSILPVITQEKISQLAIEAVNAIGILDGPAHVEIIVTTNGPKIVELGARLGGDSITTHLVPLSTGINMVELAIKSALGEPIHIELKHHKGAAIKFFDGQLGTIGSVNGYDACLRINGVRQVCLTKNIGDTIGTIQSSNDRAGYVIATADTPEEAQNICNQAISLLKIKVL